MHIQQKTLSTIVDENRINDKNPFYLLSNIADHWVLVSFSLSLISYLAFGPNTKEGK